jgi:hypothetical protein
VASVLFLRRNQTDGSVSPELDPTLPPADSIPTARVEPEHRGLAEVIRNGVQNRYGENYVRLRPVCREIDSNRLEEVNINAAHMGDGAMSPGMMDMAGTAKQRI